MEAPHEISRNKMKWSHDERALLAPLTRLNTGHCIDCQLGSEVGGTIELDVKDVQMFTSSGRKKRLYNTLLHMHARSN